MEKIAVLGVHYGGHDTSACLLIDGEIIAACEQERYTLDKHSRKFPLEAINDCLKIGGLAMSEIDEIAVCGDMNYYIRETYLKPAIKDDHRIGFLIKDIDRIKEHYYMPDYIKEKTGYKGKITFHLHHLCHLASAYYASGFESSIIASYDGMGEIETAMLGLGVNGNIQVVENKNLYPNSLGLLYTAITFYLGFIPYCDEGIVMGLAPYGDASEVIPGSGKTYREVFSEILREIGSYEFIVDQTWFEYFRVRDTWISKKFTDMFGPKRVPNSTLTLHHRNIAAALQERLETVVLNQLKKARQQYGINKLCLAGGVALNCSMNGKIEQSKIFDEIFVQPASGDSGTVIGAAYLAYKNIVGELQPKKYHNFYKGSSFSEAEIEKSFNEIGVAYFKARNIYEITAEKLSEGKIIGWFQGAAEFGPRALGNRSILTKPFPADMRDYLNNKVKFREDFRPFAPAVLEEHASSYFTISQESPHMLIACKVLPDKESEIAATVHVDKSCRVQTVKEENNLQFRRLLEEFYRKTNCPVLLNTSFNVKGQPIVNTPRQAIECFKSTNIEFLVIGNYYSEK